MNSKRTVTKVGTVNENPSGHTRQIRFTHCSAEPRETFRA